MTCAPSYGAVIERRKKSFHRKFSAYSFFFWNVSFTGAGNENDKPVGDSDRLVRTPYPTQCTSRYNTARFC